MTKNQSFFALLTAAAPALMLAATMGHAEPLALDESLRPEPRPNVLIDFLRTQKDQGRILDFSAHAPPVGMPVITQPNDTLYNIGARHLAVMGAATPFDAAARLARENTIPPPIFTPRYPPGKPSIYRCRKEQRSVPPNI